MLVSLKEDAKFFNDSYDKGISGNRKIPESFSGKFEFETTETVPVVAQKSVQRSKRRQLHDHHESRINFGDSKQTDNVRMVERSQKICLLTESSLRSDKNGFSEAELAGRIILSWILINKNESHHGGLREFRAEGFGCARNFFALVLQGSLVYLTEVATTEHLNQLDVISLDFHQTVQTPLHLVESHLGLLLGQDVCQSCGECYRSSSNIMNAASRLIEFGIIALDLTLSHSTLHSPEFRIREIGSTIPWAKFLCLSGDGGPLTLPVQSGSKSCKEGLGLRSKFSEAFSTARISALISWIIWFDVSSIASAIVRSKRSLENAIEVRDE